jgi:SAM-dependent methyltransferase
MLANFAIRRRALTRRLAPALLMAVSAGSLAAQNQIFDTRTLAPYVPTPELVVERMLEAAGVTKDDIVYDLGSGDGRILIDAAERFGCKAVGIEINPTLVAETRNRVEELGLSSLVSVQQAHLMDADLSPATVVTVYLLSSSNEQLKPKFEKELAAGARVVSHDFQFRGWKPAATIEVDGDSRPHRIYVYKMGEHLAP